MCAYMVLTNQQSPEAAARNLVDALSTLRMLTGIQEIASKIPVSASSLISCAATQHKIWRG